MTQARTVENWIVAAMLVIVAGSMLALMPPMPPEVEITNAEPELVPITLAWDASPDSNVAYRLHYGQQHTNVGTNLTWSLQVPLGSNLAYTVTAIGTNQLESEPSNQIEARPRYSNWVEVGTELMRGPSHVGPFTPTGTNALTVGEGDMRDGEFFAARAAISKGRRVVYE